ncbi:MAG: ATP-dependent DNA helicase [Candidatus Omnitrophica bacterium]|nr:ATP-dependent DNA helicase [Candidatus Omnitrophota bacterium]
MISKGSISEEFFAENGVIAGELTGYEMRPQQIEMCEAVDEAIASSENLIVEAGTGVGKSLAYLIPFIKWASRENKKVVISTYTKALQNQLFVKDLPFLERALDTDFRYMICMGSENYVCMRKVHRASSGDLFETKRQTKQREKIIKWTRQTESGLVTDMDFLPDRSVWKEFSRESDMCTGRRCPHKDECFYLKMRREQSEAHVLLVNHSLLFASITSESPVLPDFNALVLDEAHTLEDVATNHFGEEVSKLALERLFDDVSGLSKYDASGGVSGAVGEFRKSLDEFLAKVEEIFGKETRVLAIGDERSFSGDIITALEALSSALRDLSSGIDDNEDSEMVKVYAERCNKFAASLKIIFGEKDEKCVYWTNVRPGKSDVNYFFHFAPIDISHQMRLFLFDRVRPVVLTSATLSLPGAGDEFSFIKERLGMADPVELKLDSPFDYNKNVLTYIPRGIKDPNREAVLYTRQLQSAITEIYDIMGGRIFALFTSYRMLNMISDNISKDRPDIKTLRQGDLPRYVLLDVFKKSLDSILLGTMTFWQGVDVPGDALGCVIITKLPFSVPDDPINAARIRIMREEGRNPFNEYQVPQAVIMFKQGFGRLIRSNTDRGVIAVLDPRIRTRYYGKDFMSALPECRRTDDIGDVREFFSA